MKKSILGTRVVTQIGILVNDIEKACQDYAEFLGVENPGYTVTDTIDKTRAEYKGGPCEARAKLAFFRVGDNLDIELIEPDDKPSVWRDDLDKNGEGFHHIAFVIDGMKEKVMLLEKNNMPLIQKGEYTGGRYAYVNAREKLKVMIELLEND